MEEKMTTEFCSNNYRKEPVNKLQKWKEDVGHVASISLTEGDISDKDISYTVKEIMLCKLAVEISRKMRGIQFSWKNRSNNNPTLWCFYDDMAFSMGYIGYGDFNTHVASEEPEYAVYSHTIENNKYASYSDPHRMVKTIHMNKAVKNACRYLRNGTPYDVAMIEVYRAKRNFDDIGSKLFSTKSNVFNNLFTHEKMFLEFKHLLEQGHTFVDPKNQALAEDFVKVAQEEKERQKLELNLYHVRVYMDGDVQMFDVIPMHDVQRDPWNSMLPDSMKTYTSDTLPEDIMGKVSVMSMVDEESYVDGVGYKDRGGNFYVSQ